MDNSPVLYIVVPCYCEQETLPGSNAALCELLGQMVKANEVSADSRLVYVDDGSSDATWQLISRFAGESPMVRGVKLSRNFGHQNAIVAGMETMLQEGDIFITIDADLQDDIAAIPQMVAKYKEGYEIVYGVRSSRETDTWFKRTTAQGFYKLMNRLGVESVYNHADFRLMDRRTVTELLRYPERNLFVRGIVPLLGFKSTTVEYERKKRTAGVTKYSLSKMIGFAVDGITSFSSQPVRMVFNLGLIFLVIAFGILVYVLYSKLSGHAVSGWSSMILSLWFVGGCILMGLGIVGEYIGKIYAEVKARPRYHVDQITPPTPNEK